MPLFFKLLGSKTFFGIRKVACTEYQVFISKLTFIARFWISNYQFDIRNSIFDIQTAAVYHLIRVKKPSSAFGKLPNIMFLISKLTFNAQFLISNYHFSSRMPKNVFDPNKMKNSGSLNIEL